MKRTWSEGRRWLITGAVAAPLLLVAVPPMPSVEAAGFACQMSAENKCCTCGDRDGEFFCHGGATIGSEYCDDPDYCSGVVCIAEPQ